MTKVVIVGTGGVGAIAALALSYSDAEVTAIVRSDYEKVSKEGFHIKSVDYGEQKNFKPANVAKSVEDAKQFGPFDYVIVTTKNTPDIFKTEELVEPLVSDNSTIVLIQNGIGIELAFLEKYPKHTLLSGVTMISSSNYYGVVDHVGHDDMLIGYFPNDNLSKDTQEKKALEFVSLYKNKYNDCEYNDDVKYTRWRKLVYNATLNPVCALTECDVGRLELFGGMDLVRKAMREVLAVAKADGVELPESIMEFMIRSDDGVYYLPSMLVDVKKQNYMEVEILSGNPVRIAKKHGVPTPCLELIYELLKVVQAKMAEAKGKIVVPKDRPIPGK